MRIADNNTRTRHSEEIAFLNALVIDLKKAVIKSWGREKTFLDDKGITMDRLDEATRALDKLQQCKEVVNWK